MGKRVSGAVAAFVLLSGLAACSSEPESAGKKSGETSGEQFQQAADEGACTAEATPLAAP
ncbi:MAG: hypothetical protein ACR2FP_11305 [Nocardioidaceae bacterium]